MSMVVPIGNQLMPLIWLNLFCFSNCTSLIRNAWLRKQFHPPTTELGTVGLAGSLNHHYMPLPFNWCSPLSLLLLLKLYYSFFFDEWCDDDLFFLLTLLLLLLLVFFIFFYNNMFGLTPRRMATAACTLLHQVETEVVTGHRTEWTFCIVLSLPESHGARECLHSLDHCSASSFTTIVALQVQLVPVASFPPSNHYYWYEVFPPEIRRWRVWREGRGRRN